MRYLPRSIIYGVLLNEAIELSNWDADIEDVGMKYLHHNGLFFSLISLEDENDIVGMLMASGSEKDGLHVYVNRKLHAVNNQREGSRYVSMSYFFNIYIVAFVVRNLISCPCLVLKGLRSSAVQVPRRKLTKGFARL